MSSSSQGGFIVGRENVKSCWENMDPIAKVILGERQLPGTLRLTMAGSNVGWLWIQVVWATCWRCADR